MAVTILLDSVITRRSALEDRFPGGLDNYRETDWAILGFARADSHLSVFSEMSGGQVAARYGHEMAQHGIEYVRGGHFVDIALVCEADLRHWYPEVSTDWPVGVPPSAETPLATLQVSQSRIPCDWLEYGVWGGSFVCWLRGTRPGLVATPREPI